MHLPPSVHVYFAHCFSELLICQSHTVRIKHQKPTRVIHYTKPGTVHILRLWIFASLHLTTADLRNFTSRSLHQLLMSVCISSPGVLFQVKHRHSSSKAQEQVEGHWRLEDTEFTASHLELYGQCVFASVPVQQSVNWQYKYMYLSASY